MCYLLGAEFYADYSMQPIMMSINVNKQILMPQDIK